MRQSVGAHYGWRDWLAQKRRELGFVGAVSVFAHWPPAALGVLTLGGLWLCLMSAPWRLGGLIALPIASALILANPHPEVFISDDGDNAGVIVKTPDSRRAFAIYDKRKGRFDSDVWMEQAGFEIGREKPLKLSDFAACDQRGCATEINGEWIAISGDRAGFEDDCDRADVVIALYPVLKSDRESCRAALVDRRDAWAAGAHALFITRDKVRIVSAADLRGVRPWSGG